MSRSSNVVVLFTDQQRWDTTGLNGCPLDLTPNLDRLAQRGTHLRHCFTPQPVCGPARACMQSGRYATEVGCHHNGQAMPPGGEPLGEVFRRGGYRTGYIGKWHLGPPDSEGPVPPEFRGGYEDWLASNALEFTSDAYQTTLYDNDQKPVRLPGYRVDALADAAIRWIDSRKGDPFFLFVSFIEPHQQNHRACYPAPVGYAERYAGRWMPPDLAMLGGDAHRHWGGYCGMVRRIDEAVGRIQDALISLGLADDTVVAFTSDHGNHFKTRNSEYKRSHHDASIRVPGAFWGGAFTGGGEVSQLVTLLDISATVVDAAGLSVPDTYRGRSILPLLTNRSAAWPDEVFAQISETECGRVVRTARWKYAVRAPQLAADAEVDLRPWHPVMEEIALYDLESDPMEMDNLIEIPAYRPVAERMRERLCDRMRGAGEEVPEIVFARQRATSGQRSVGDDEIRR